MSFQATTSNHTDDESKPSRLGSSDAQIRANAYQMLGALLRKPPTTQLIRNIVPERESSQDEAARYRVSEKFSLPDAWIQLADAARQPLNELALQDEYNALFIGVVRGELMPYGSWYMSGYLMDKPLADLRRDLQALGFERAEGISEPEDHAAALCETMAMIIPAADISERGEQTFFQRHLQPWMGLFFTDLENAKGAQFYKSVGFFGQQFMAFEKQYFDI